MTDLIMIAPLLILLLILLVLFIIMARKGISKGVLIASFIIAALLYFNSSMLGFGVAASLINSLPQFFFSYVVIEGIRRFISNRQKKNGSKL